MEGTIALLTDFGLADPYVGQMKGVLARLAPGVLVVDVSHGVRPHNVAQGSFFLAASAAHFPVGTVFIAVVDPGVGTSRRVVLAEGGGRYFLAPDNGLLSFLLATPGTWKLFDATPEEKAGSATFHGRDVFAPLGARLAMGKKPAQVARPWRGEPPITKRWARPARSEEGIEAMVLHVDRFGNCVTNLSAAEWEAILPLGGEIRLPAIDRTARRVRVYQDLEKGALGLLTGSQGHMELAVNRGSAARILDLQPGAGLRLEFQEATGAEAGVHDLPDDIFEDDPAAETPDAREDGGSS